MYNINIPYIYIYTYIHNTAYFHISSTGNLTLISIASPK